MKKTVTLDLKPVTVEVDVPEEMKDKDVLELAKAQLVKNLTKKFPPLSYSIAEGTIINEDEIKAGRPIRLKSDGEIAIIYAYKPMQKYPIKLATVTGKLVSCTKEAIEPISKRTSIEKLIQGRDKFEREIQEWFTGKTAFFVNGKEIIPVIIENTGRGPMKAIIVGHDAKGSYFKLSAPKLNLFDTYNEAENYACN